MSDTESSSDWDASSEDEDSSLQTTMSNNQYSANPRVPLGFISHGHNSSLDRIPSLKNLKLKEDLSNETNHYSKVNLNSDSKYHYGIKKNYKK